MEPDKKEHYYAVNIFGISAVEFLWGIGLPVLVESTFLQLFLKSLGASHQIIGLIPSIMGAGIAVFALMSAYLTAHLAHKRRAVVWSHISVSIPIFIFGIVLFFMGKTPYTVTVFLIFFVLSSLALGLTIPIWQNFLVKIFSEERTIPAISIMLVSQMAAKLIGGLVIVKFVERYYFSTESASAVFIILGILFFAGSFFFLFVREIHSGNDPAGRDAHNFKTLARAVIGTFHNKNFILYLVGMTESYTCITIISFYANYAVDYHSVPQPVAAGLFVACIYASGIVINILFGWFNLFSLRNKLVISRIFAVGAVVCLLAADSTAWFLMTSLLLGVSRAVSNLCFSPAVKKLSGMHDATDYFAVSQMLLLPLSFGIPYLSGLFLDGYSDMGAVSFKILFGICGILIMISLACVARIDFD
jgi:MFS family permease